MDKSFWGESGEWGLDLGSVWFLYLIWIQERNNLSFFPFQNTVLLFFIVGEWAKWGMYDVIRVFLNDWARYTIIILHLGNFTVYQDYDFGYCFIFV